MKKRILSLLLVITCLLTVCPLQVSAIVPIHTHEGNTGSYGTAVLPLEVNPLYADVLEPVPFPDAQVSTDDVDLSPSLDDYLNWTDTVQAIRDNMKARATTFNVYYISDQYTAAGEIIEITSSTLSQMFEEALQHTGVPTEGDYLYRHYTQRSMSSSYFTQSGKYYVTLTVNVSYHDTAEQQVEMDAAVESLLAELDLDSCDHYEQISAVYDYICDNVVYDDANLNDDSYTLKYTAYAALVNGTAVCQGYASLFYRLMLELGVDTRVIRGYSFGGNHAWNLVRLNGLYYNVDSTWDAGKDEYDYFLRCQSTFTDHERREEYDTDDFHSHYLMATRDYDPLDPEMPAPPFECEHQYGEWERWDNDTHVKACTLCGHGEWADHIFGEHTPVNGRTHREECTLCEYYRDSEHVWDDGIVTVPPTAETSGELTRTCTLCQTTKAEVLSRPETSVEQTPAISSNLDGYNYVNSYRWSSPIRSSLTREDGGYLRVEAIGDVLTVERYDENLQFISRRDIPLDLPKFGGIYICSDYNFVAMGQDNYEEDDDAEVIRVICFTKDWERVGHASLYAANTVAPFEAGTMRFARSGDALYIRTCREMYATVDGVNHQTNMTFCVNIPTLTVTKEINPATGHNLGYASHSFNQFILVDGTDILALDHGDAYPRAVAIYRNNLSALASTPEMVRVLPIAQSTGHYNDTGVAMGGFEYSDTHYLTAGNSTTQAGGINFRGYQRNIFVTATPKGDFTAEATTTTWITNYDEGTGVTLGTPQLTKLNDGRFFLMWTADGVINCCYITADGQLDGSVFEAEGSLSDCLPIQVGDRLIWYVTNNSAPVFYSIDLTDPGEVVVPHTHTYTTAVTPPTCTEQGFTTYTCECGKNYASDYVDATGHTYSEWTVAVAPTAETEGSKTRECSICGEIETVSLAFMEPVCGLESLHPYEDESSLTWTYSEPGAFCLLVTFDSRTALEKGYDFLTIYTGDGTQVGRYSGDELADTTVRVAGDTVKLLLETDVGNNLWGFRVTRIEPVFHTHSYTADVTPPTCTEQGFTTFTCECGDSYVEHYTEATGHIWGEWQVATPPTEVFTGREQRICEECGDVESRVLDPLPHSHNYFSTVTSPTCTEGGYTTYTCLGCGNSYVTDHTEPAGHNYLLSDLIPASCTEGGYSSYTCFGCGDSYVSDYVEAIGHCWGAWHFTVEPTEETAGEERRECILCHEAETREAAALEHTHNYIATIQYPTCIEGGFTTYTCTGCGDSYVSDYTDIRDHFWGEWSQTTAPTVTQPGKEQRTCALCRITETREIPPVAHTSHTYYPVSVTPPTCTEQGYRTYVCICGSTMNEFYEYPTGHTWDEWVQTLAPTEYESGEERRECAACGESETREIAPLGHTHSYSTTVTPPTCTQQGYTTHTCPCGDSYTDSYTAATGHQWSEWTQTLVPTEYESGEERKECAVCGESETREIAPLGHTHSYSATVTPPTCTQQGYTTHTCPCGDSYVTDYVEAIGHSWGEWENVKAATEMQGGEEKRECSACGESETRTTDPIPHSHLYNTREIQPVSCTEPGFVTHLCACGDSYVSDYQEALGHQWGEWQVTAQPTEQIAGSERRMCSRCYEFEYRELPVLEHVHSYTASVTPPTCTEKGYTTHTCPCGDSYTDSYTAATGHQWSEWTQTLVPTEYESGEERRECAACGASETRETAPLGHTHSYSASVTPPTCTEKGYTTHTCPCGDSYTDSYTAATGHSHSPVITPPTCTKEGYTTHTCPCGDSYTDSYTAATGHRWSAWEVTEPATATHGGVELRECSACYQVETRDTPSLSAKTFIDVFETDWYYSSVYWAVDEGVTSGTGDGTTFSPLMDCSRAQVVTFLWRAVGSPEVTGENPFIDVDEGAWYYNAVLWAVENGITTGTSATTFSPDMACSRAQVVTFLYRTAGSPNPMGNNPFTDVSKDAWYYDAVLWAVGREVTSGTTPTTFAPDMICSRSQVVTFLYRANI